MDKQGLVEVLNAARAAKDPPPHSVLLKYPNLYVNGTIGATGIAVVRVLEWMKGDGALAALDGGAIVTGRHLNPLRADNIARWVWDKFALNGNAVAAVDALDDVVTLNHAAATTYVILGGVDLAQPVDINRDLRLVPLAEIESRPMVKSIFSGDANLSRKMPAQTIPLTAMVYRQQVSPVFMTRDELRAKAVSWWTDNPSAARDEWLRVLKNAVGLIGPCGPIILADWTELDADSVPQPDRYVWVPGGQRWSNPAPYFGPFDMERGRALLQKFLCLPAEVRQQLDVPLDRLNAATLQVNPVARAIDLGIALEAVLLHDMQDTESVSYRLALRGACFLEKLPDRRKQCFNELKQLYALRSQAVHRGRLKSETVRVAGQTPRATARFLEDGLALCSALITKLIECGGLPDWEEVVLAPLSKATRRPRA